jgi:hypothetical protein
MDFQHWPLVDVTRLPNELRCGTSEQITPGLIVRTLISAVLTDRACKLQFPKKSQKLQSGVKVTNAGL